MGLRGVIGLAMALIVAETSSMFPPHLRRPFSEYLSKLERICSIKIFN